MARTRSTFWQIRAIAEIERRKRSATVSPRRTFTQQYYNDPVGWVHDCLHWIDEGGPVNFQEEILAALPERRRVCVRGPHGLGKTSLNAWAILWFATTRDADDDDWKVPTTASAWRQLTKFLWPEIRKWTRKINWKTLARSPFKMRFEQMELALKLGTGEAFAMASDNAEFIEGAHADRLLYVFDESKAIPDPTWDSAEGAFSTGDAYWLATSTPGEPNGRFYEIQSRKPGYEDWFIRAVTLEECITAGRISPSWAESRRRQWGEDSAVYKNRVLGEFASSDEDGVIPLGWIEKANARYLEWVDAGKVYPRFEAMGVDVGRGGDKSVLAPRFDQLISELRRSGKADTMELVGQIAGILKSHTGRGKAVIDVIGIGAGVVDRLREQKFPVVAFNAAEKTDRLDITGELGFTNVRSAAWWNLREILDPANEIQPALPPDDLLIGDLTSPHWRVLSGGKIQVESKDDIRRRLGRSTDDGDAVVQAYWPEGDVDYSSLSGLGHVEDHESRWK